MDTLRAAILADVTFCERSTAAGRLQAESDAKTVRVSPVTEVRLGNREYHLIQLKFISVLPDFFL